MSPLWLDVEVLADREEDLQALNALLTEDEGADHDVPPGDDELPPIVQDEIPDGTRERQRDDYSVSSPDKAESFAESPKRFLRRIADEQE